MPRVSRFLFKAMVQAMLLLGSETCVFTTHMGRSLGRFQDQVAIRMTGWIPQRKPDGKWTYTLAVTAREEAGFLTMGY